MTRQGRTAVRLQYGFSKHNYVAANTVTIYARLKPDGAMEMRLIG